MVAGPVRPSARRRGEGHLREATQDARAHCRAGHSRHGTAERHSRRRPAPRRERRRDRILSRDARRARASGGDVRSPERWPMRRAAACGGHGDPAHMSLFRKILDLFEPRERLDLAGLCVVIILVAFVQTIGVASIMPFMGLVANPEMVTESERMRCVYDALDFESTRSFLLFLGLLVLGIMAFSNAFTAFEQWLMLRFVWRKQHRLSVRLLEQYMYEPYTFYLDHNTSGLAKNILSEVHEVINNVLVPVLKILAQTLVMACILGLLIWVDPQIALAAIVVLGGGYGAIYVAVRRRQGRLGKVRRNNHTMRFKTASEALGSIKETKVLGREAEFLKRFATADRRYSSANASNAIVRDMPKFALETIA